MIELSETDIITVDFPWRYRNWSDTARGAAAAHYVGMTYQQGKALTPVMEQVRKKDSIIVQWTTWPKLDQGMDLLREWGWGYVTGFPWIKTTADFSQIKRTVGFWAMGCSEIVLIGRKGNTPKHKKLEGGNVLGLLCGSQRQFYDRIQRHSQKPYGIAEWLEEKFPEATFTELFATKPREGWNAYGHRVGTHIAPDGVLTLEEAIARGDLPKGYDPFHDPIRKGQPRGAEAPAELGKHDDPAQTEMFGAGYMGICAECDEAWVLATGSSDIVFPFDNEVGYHAVCWNRRDRKTEEVVDPEMDTALHEAMLDF